MEGLECQILKTNIKKTLSTKQKALLGKDYLVDIYMYVHIHIHIHTHTYMYIFFSIEYV